MGDVKCGVRNCGVSYSSYLLDHLLLKEFILEQIVRLEYVSFSLKLTLNSTVTTVLSVKIINNQIRAQKQVEQVLKSKFQTISWRRFRSIVILFDNNVQHEGQIQTSIHADYIESCPIEIIISRTYVVSLFLSSFI